MAIKKETSKRGGIPSRIGKNFSEEIERIKDERLLNGKSKERISTEKITNLIVRHKNWKEVALNITNASQGEVETYGI